MAYSGTLECNFGSTAANYQDISAFMETYQAIKMHFLKLETALEKAAQ